MVIVTSLGLLLSIAKTGISERSKSSGNGDPFSSARGNLTGRRRIEPYLSKGKG